MTPEEKKRIEKIPTSSMTAYDLYLKANDFQKDYQESRDPSSYQTAVNLYNAALDLDPDFAKAYTGLAIAYFNRYQWETYFKENYLDSMGILIDKALSIDDELNEAYYYKGQYYSQIGDNDKALENFDKALKYNPNYYLAYVSKGDIYSRVLGDYVNGLGNYHKALPLVRGNERPALLGSLGGRYMEIGFIDKAKYYYQDAFDQDSNKSLHLRRLSWTEFSLENFEETLKLVKQGCETDSLSCINTELMFFNVPSGHKEEAYLFAKKKIEQYKRTGTIALQTAFQIGYAFWQVGQYQESKDFFSQQIKYDEESIRLKRAISQVGNAQYDLASTYAFLGEKVKAYKYLEEFVSMYFPKLWQISYAKHNPFMKSISNEEQYKKLLQTMEVKYQAEHEKVRKWLEENNML
jgi:tetratricopeptide (TPR) repeat protein